MTQRGLLAVYWASSCGGCEVALANLHELFLELTERVELFFCPALVDTKKSDLAALADGGLALTLFDGALRTDENVEMARLLRRKSRVLVAFGACAQGGGVPALSNLSSRAEHLRTLYQGQPEASLPREQTRLPEGTLRLPGLHERVKCLSSVVEVDYVIPGCPPEPSRIWAAVTRLLAGPPLPPPGSVLGGGAATVCDECARQRQGRPLSAFRRVSDFAPSPEECLLDQGLPCLGLGTRGGCGGLCPEANMPCTGCYGPPDGVYDQPAKLASALASLVDVSDLRGRDEAEIGRRVDAVLDTLPDVAGTLGRYGLAARPGCREPERG